MKHIYLFTFLLFILSSLKGQTVAITNSSPINIIDNNKASLYSSNITVSGLTGNIASVSVTINNFSHSAPGDVAIALQAPNGTAMIIQEGFWGSTPASSLTYMISDLGTSQVGFWDFPATGTVKPSANSVPLPSFDAPGPLSSYTNPGPSNLGTATMTSTFGGLVGNGVWKLWVMDIASGDAGVIAGGWTLTINPTTPLPVHISKFDANCLSGDKVEVSWTTQNEENTSIFVIQSSTDGTYFEKVKELSAAGNSNMEINYKVSIPQLSSKQFIRIRSEDLDGKYTYSNVLNVDCSVKQDISVSPNPFSGSFYLNNPNGDYITYKVLDLNGRVMLSGSTHSNKQSIDLADLAIGMYYLQTRINNQEKTLKLFNR